MAHWIKASENWWQRANTFEEALGAERTIEADVGEAAKLIAAETGRYACPADGRIRLADLPIFYNQYDRPEERSFPYLLVHLPYLKVLVPRKVAGEPVFVFGRGEDGRYAVRQNDGLFLVRCDRAYVSKLLTKHAAAARTKAVNLSMFHPLREAVAAAMHYPLSRSEFKTHDALLWVCAAESLFGKRAANKLLRPIALAWAASRDASIMKFRDNAPDQLVALLDEKLSKIVKKRAKIERAN